MSEHAFKILFRVYLNIILGVVPCEPENEDDREEIFADYIADTTASMVEYGDISAIDAFYGMADLCHTIWKKEGGEEKKDAT